MHILNKAKLQMQNIYMASFRPICIKMSSITLFLLLMPYSFLHNN